MPLKNQKPFCLLAVLGLSLVLGASANDPAPLGTSFNRLIHEAAVALLKEGNARYLSGKSQHPNLDAERRASTVADGQEPLATILACSDSREPVELIFDRGIGDLFVVRVAGNIAGVSELATVEYGVGHLNTPLLVVMGHTKCGAVTAVVKGAELHGHLPALAEKIKPAVELARTQTADPDAVVPAAIRANVLHTIGDIISQSSIVREKLIAGKVQIVGAVYDLEQGTVAWLGAHPDEQKMLALASVSESATDHHKTAPVKTVPAPFAHPSEAAGSRGSPTNKSPAAPPPQAPPAHHDGAPGKHH